MKKIIFSLFFSFLTILTIASSPSCAYYSLEEATALYNMGIDYYSQNQVQKSMDYFKKAISLNPKFYEAYYNLAQIQASYGYTDAAIKSYEKVIQLKPQDYESALELSKLLYKRGYLNRAQAALAKIPDSDSHYSEAQKFSQKIKARQTQLLVQQQKAQMQQELQSKMTIDLDKQNQAQEPPKTEVQKPQQEDEPKLEQSNLLIELSAPSGVAVDSMGNVYAASFSQNKVYKITPSGEKTIFVEFSQLGGPIGMAVDAYDNLYVANYTKNNILRVTPQGVASEFAKVKKPYCIAVDSTRKILIVSEQDGNKILKFEL